MISRRREQGDRRTRTAAIISLTNRPLDVVSEPDRPARETDTEDCEVEITPEMTSAGVSAFLDGDLRFQNEASIVEDIFKKMVVLSPYWRPSADSDLER
jgi:hypothetical protein